LVPRATCSPRQLGRVHVGEVRGRDDEVDVGVLVGEPQRRLSRRDPGERGRVVQVQVAELTEQALRQLPRLLEDEGVVGSRDQEDVHDAVAHQVLVVVEAAARGRAVHRVSAEPSLGPQAITRILSPWGRSNALWEHSVVAPRS